METAKAQLEAERLRTTLAGDELNQAKERFSEGLGDNLGVVQAQRSRSTAELAHIQAVGDLLKARVNFLSALGSINPWIRSRWESSDYMDTATTPGIDTRIALIQTAVAQLMASGWASVRMRDLAKTVGIQAPSIYHHFGKKTDLGVAIIDFLKGEVQAASAQIAEENASLHGRLMGLLRMHESEGHCAQSCPLYNLQAEFPALPEEMQVAVQNLVQVLLNTLQGWIDDALAAGEISFSGPLGNPSQILLSTYEHGYQLQRLLEDNKLEAMLQTWYGYVAKNEILQPVRWLILNSAKKPSGNPEGFFMEIIGEIELVLSTSASLFPSYYPCWFRSRDHWRRWRYCWCFALGA